MSYVSKENLDNIIKGLSNKIAMSVSNGALIGDTTPVGTVISFMGTQAPLFYLICDGTTYNIAEYQELADFIEAQFGAVNYFGGDGVTTFAVPDLRGEFLRGTGTNSHANQGSGANVGTHQDATKHVNIVVNREGNNIYFTSCADVGSSAVQSDLSITTNNNKNGWVKNTDSYDATKASHTWASAGGSNTTKETPYYTSRPTNTSVLYCIKYTKAVIPSEYEDGTPVGRVIFDSILREGYIKANGAQIEDASIAIPRLLSFVQKYSSQLIAHNQETYDANVGLYMYDSNADILTLPNYIGRFMEGGNSVTSIEAGLPNIEGTTGYVNNSSVGITGAFYIISTSTSQSRINAPNALYNTKFDASRSSSIYGNSTTVQPSSISLIPQIRY